MKVKQSPSPSPSHRGRGNWFYLASQSPRRRALLKEARIPYQICTSSHREKIRLQWSARKNALWNAEGKALQARTYDKSRWILAADTLVSVRGKILGKPKDVQQARRFLKLLSGTTHRVYTAVVLYQPCSNKKIRACDVTKVTFNSLSSSEIDQIIHQHHLLDKAGAYAIQEHGDCVVKNIVGSRTNVVGLPMELVKKLLKKI